MSRYMEDKKMRERVIGALISMCKTYGYELNEQEQKRLKRMKFSELHEFSSNLSRSISQRQHEVFPQVLKKLNQDIEKCSQAFRAFGANQE